MLIVSLGYVLLQNYHCNHTIIVIYLLCTIVSSITTSTILAKKYDITQEPLSKNFILCCVKNNPFLTYRNMLKNRSKRWTKRLLSTYAEQIDANRTTIGNYKYHTKGNVSIRLLFGINKYYTRASKGYFAFHLAKSSSP